MTGKKYKLHKCKWCKEKNNFYQPDPRKTRFPERFKKINLVEIYLPSYLILSPRFNII